MMSDGQNRLKCACCLAWASILFVVLAQAAFGATVTNRTDWWSFRPATKPAVPAGVAHPIDAFIRASLSRQELPPAPEADRRTLIRRVTFDLIGLPPTPEETAAFLSDSRPDAYEQVVDRLLASPRHGERWARHWLDAVHYGESHGYDKDKPRLNAWPYRDYVIRALNTDKPYARFVEEQLAGDVLYPESPDAVPALGFIAAGPWDFVGHVELPITKTDGLIARYNDRDDMVMNAMSTFQSLTVHCARCHDHKFDPITQRDYYGLQAVFAGVDRADRAFDADAGVAKERRELNEALKKLAEERKGFDDELTRLGGAELNELDRQISNALSSAKSDKAAFGYHSQIALKQDVEKWVQVDLGESRELDRIVYVGCHDDFNGIGAGFGFPRRYKIEVSTDAEFHEDTIIVQDNLVDDVPNPGVVPQEVPICGCLTPDGSAVKARYVRFTAAKLALRQNDFIFALGELMVLNAAGQNVARGAKVSALDSIEAPIRWQKKNLVDGYYYGLETNNLPLVAELRAKRENLLQRVLPASVREARSRTESDQKKTRDRLAKLPKPQVVYAATHEFTASGSFSPAREPRPVHLLRRGDVKRLGDEMKPAGVAAVPGVSADFEIQDSRDEGARRAALAKWITSTNNLLTRRSIVNRVWHYHFGRGLVETPNDFGHMGALPSHPELLDWLAFWFLENGESFKSLHRLIVTSATYRQAATATSTTMSKDSGNRLLARMNRTRLDAEQFRDAVLAVSGQLDLTMGGPSVQQFAFKDDHSPVYDYASYDPSRAGANRRGIYRFIVRSVPDPFMDALDCPDANTLTPVRNTTMTALQALATLNDAFVLRQCEHFAARLQRERRSVEGQMARAYDLALNRPPSPDEQGKLVEHARRHGLPAACRVLFNSNEFMFID